MLDTDQLKQLKRVNISKSPEKTKQRVTALWKSLKIKQKQAIRELADITPQPIYRTQETGTISAKVTLAFAQSLNVNPFYLIGETDEPGVCTDELIRDLLLKFGYQNLVAQIEKPVKRPYNRRPKVEAESEPEEETTDDATSTEEPVSQPEPVLQLPPGSDTLTVEDFQNLIFALYVQAKAGIISSKEKLDKITLVIFS